LTKKAQISTIAVVRPMESLSDNNFFQTRAHRPHLGAGWRIDGRYPEHLPVENWLVGV
jgi:hypothetical protein